MANDSVCWTFDLPGEEPLRALPFFERGTLDEALASRMARGHAVTSRNDYLHRALGQLRSIDGAPGVDALLDDVRTVAGREAEPGGHHGFVVSGIPPQAGSAAMATLRSWLALAETRPETVGEALDEDDLDITEELEAAAEYAEDEDYGLEGDRPAVLFWFVRRLLALLERAQAEGAVVVQVRYVYF